MSGLRPLRLCLLPSLASWDSEVASLDLGSLRPLSCLSSQAGLLGGGWILCPPPWQSSSGCSPIGRTEWWECFKRGFEDGGLMIPGGGSSWRESTKVRSNISMAPTRSSWSIWSAIWARSHIVKPVSLAATWSAKAAAVSLFAGFLGAPLTTAGEGFWNPPPPRELYKIQLRPPQLEKSTPGQLLEGLLARDARWESQARNIGDHPGRWLGCRAEGSPQFQVQIHQD